MNFLKISCFFVNIMVKDLCFIGCLCLLRPRYVLTFSYFPILSSDSMFLSYFFLNSEGLQILFSLLFYLKFWFINFDFF